MPTLVLLQFSFRPHKFNALARYIGGKPRQMPSAAVSCRCSHSIWLTCSWNSFSLVGVGLLGLVRCLKSRTSKKPQSDFRTRIIAVGSVDSTGVSLAQVLMQGLQDWSRCCVESVELVWSTPVDNSSRRCNADHFWGLTTITSPPQFTLFLAQPGLSAVTTLSLIHHHCKSHWHL